MRLSIVPENTKPAPKQLGSTQMTCPAAAQVFGRQLGRAHL
jgi:hypothetical protein